MSTLPSKMPHRLYLKKKKNITLNNDPTQHRRHLKTVSIVTEIKKRENRKSHL